MKVYNVSKFTEFLLQFKTFEDMLEGFKKECPSVAERRFFIEHYKKDIQYYGREFTGAFDVPPSSAKLIRRLLNKNKYVTITKIWE